MRMPGFYAEGSLSPAIKQYQARAMAGGEAPSSANVVQPAGPMTCASCHWGCGFGFSSLGCHASCEAWCHWFPF